MRISRGVWLGDSAMRVMTFCTRWTFPAANGKSRRISTMRAKFCGLNSVQLLEWPYLHIDRTSAVQQRIPSRGGQPAGFHQGRSVAGKRDLLKGPGSVMHAASVQPVVMTGVKAVA